MQDGPCNILRGHHALIGCHRGDAVKESRIYRTRIDAGHFDPFISELFVQRMGNASYCIFGPAVPSHIGDPRSARNAADIDDVPELISDHIRDDDPRAIKHPMHIGIIH